MKNKKSDLLDEIERLIDAEKGVIPVETRILLFDRIKAEINMFLYQFGNDLGNCFSKLD